jgi:cytochrome c553
VHRNTKCEVCHGAAREHPVDGPLPKPVDAIKLCTVCHEAMPGRPATQPQIVIAEHPIQHDGALQCLTCHNPHSPKLGGQEEPVQAAAVAAPTAPAQLSARLVKLTTPCTPCHGADGRNAAMSAALAGRDGAVLSQRLREYRSGALQNPVMNAVTKSLNDDDIADLAEHYASLPGG